MNEVMGRKVTEILREEGDYFAVLTTTGVACGIVGGRIVHTPNKADIRVLVKAAKSGTETFEDTIDGFIILQG